MNNGMLRGMNGSLRGESLENGMLHGWRKNGMQQVRSDLGFNNEFIQIRVHLEVYLKFQRTSTSLFVIA